MFATGSEFFLLLPNATPKRVLHPGRIVSCAGGVFCAELSETLALGEGREVLVFAMVRNKFMQQGAAVVANEETAAPNTLRFTLVGEPVSAESRQTYRVSVALADLLAVVGKEKDCQVVDVSSEGFAVIAKSAFEMGASVKVSFTAEGQTVDGLARVQTVKMRNDGKFRYGFLIADRLSPARKALNAISMAVQRQQLKRLSAAA